MLNHTLTPDPLTRSIYTNQQTTFTLTLAPLNGFNHPLTLSVSGLPNGVVPSWYTNPATPPAAPTLTITTSSITPAGDYPLTLFATDGTLTHTTQVTLNVLPLPDLAVTEVTLTPNPVTFGTSVTLSTQVTNPGPGSAKAFTVSWKIIALGQVNPILSGSWEVAGLAAGANTTLTANLTAPAPGPYAVIVVADSALVLPDPDRTNNTRQAELGVTGRLDICGNISTDTTWAYATYVLTCQVVIDQNVTLTIRDSAVVKFTSWWTLIADGTLDVQGTAPNPVVFTSIRDDDYGGDSDGSASSGSPGDWAAIEINAIGSAHFDQTLIRYGGQNQYYRTNSLRDAGGTLTLTHTAVENGTGPGIAQYGGSLSVANSTFAHNYYGIQLIDPTIPPILDHVVFNANTYGLYVTGGPAPSLTLCSFVGNSSYGLYNNSSNLINAASSWWGSATGPYHATLNPQVIGDVVSNNVTFSPWLSAQP